MTEIKPQFLDEESYAAKFDRQPVRDILTEGIVATGDLEITELDTPGMGVTVASGAGYVQGDQAATQGHYRIFNDASKNLSIAASDPTNPRKDRIIAQIYDSIDIGGVDDEWVLEVLTGVAAPAPDPPALPDDALDLAIVLVGNGVTEILNADITDQRSQIDLQNLAYANLVTIATAQTITGQKTITSPLFIGTLDGWISAGETLTYGSASTFTISGDKTGKYSVGMKIKLTQTTIKYFYISAVSYSDPNTTITVKGAGLYTVADAVITNPYYSTANLPQGFPIKMIPGYVKASAYLGTNMVNIANTTWTKITLDTENYDIGSDFASNKFTAPVSGYYRISGEICWGNTNVLDTKRFFTAIYKNGVVYRYTQICASGNTQALHPTLSFEIYLAKDDYIELYCYHDNGTNNIRIDGTLDTSLDISLISII